MSDGVHLVDPYREAVASTRNNVTANVRKLPTVNSAQIGTIAPGDDIAYLPAVSGEAVSGLPGSAWIPVRLGAQGENAVYGYIHAALLVMPEEDKHFAWIPACPE